MAGFAALTFLGWLIVALSFPDALMRAAAVLIITCPCALGLAAPGPDRRLRAAVLTRNGWSSPAPRSSAWPKSTALYSTRPVVLTYGRPALLKA